jgi:hypothetical protein
VAGSFAIDIFLPIRFPFRLFSSSLMNTVYVA